MNRILMSFFFISLAILIIQTVSHSTDVNDEWILDGIFPAFLLLTIAYVAVIVFSTNLKLIALVTAIYVSTINIVPNLKYVFIYGFSDPLPHYGFAKEITESGHVPSVGFYADSYGSSPGLHILVSTLSLACGLDVVNAMKLLLVTLPFILPLAVYIVAKKTNLPFGLSKWAIASTAITSPTTYIFTGTSSAFPMFTIFLYLLLLSFSQARSRSFSVVCLMAWAAVLVFHDVTSFFLILVLVSFLLIIAVRKPVSIFSSMSSPQILLLVICVASGLAHLVFTSNANFSRLIFLVKDSVQSLFLKGEVMAPQYYPAFYNLTLGDQLKLLIVRGSKDALNILFLVMSLAILYWTRHKNARVTSFYKLMTIPLALATLAFLLPLAIRPSETRGLYYLGALMPFLCGAVLYHVIGWKVGRINKIVSVTTFLVLLLLSILQTYPCQPLLPHFTQNQVEYYVVDWRKANTIYERSLILFVNSQDRNMTIAVDAIIRWQIYGLGSTSTQALLTWDEPLSGDIIKAQMILLAYGKEAHVTPSGRVAAANEQYVHKTILVNGVVYDNGKAYAVLNMNSTYPNP